jgi:ABC-type polysaccharide/polyol phosphate transport system ATPase subunit
MNSAVIEVQDVSKKYRVYHDRNTTLKEFVLFNRTRYTEHVVLRGINLKVLKGQTVGIIGHNGSGKSTLLKLMTGIIYPDSGTITIRGKTSSLLELGAGFHPEFSGKENIYYNAAVFGLTRKEIDDRYQEIVDFSELHEYIDNPVRTYSSGMYMRLAFSVAIHVDADILLVDEILSVGDENFQKKCQEKVWELKKENKTFVIVSHSRGMIQQLCDEVVWLHDGVIRARGTPDEVYERYDAKV